MLGSPNFHLPNEELVQAFDDTNGWATVLDL